MPWKNSGLSPKKLVNAKTTPFNGRNIPQHNLHFIMGTMASHPRTFIVIGLLRSKLDLEEVSKQGALDF